MNISAGMINRETVILNRLSDERASLVGSCRFFGNEKVSSEALIREAAFRCGNAAKGSEVLAIQDTSEIKFRRHSGKLSRQDSESGPVGNNKDIGFFIHPVLVPNSQDGFPSGF